MPDQVVHCPCLHLGLTSASVCLCLTIAFAADPPPKSAYEPKVSPASKDGEVAIQTFRVPKDLRMELVATEPDVANPVAFWIDERGRFYEAETFWHGKENRA